MRELVPSPNAKDWLAAAFLMLFKNLDKVVESKSEEKSKKQGVLFDRSKGVIAPNDPGDSNQNIIEPCF